MGFPEAAGSFRTHQIKAAPIGSAVGRFKANLVFKETEKKLKEEGEQFIRRLTAESQWLTWTCWL
ncbi:non-specific lipid-transfer protein-like [Puma concolor]|uniref:Non-specific lipid-transfer protein-like n=1 Tax=Puma concolor TaxID=9696 RepID=A0A6P6H8Y4_PUMCO|nr:non-specific lipid-transfer protein-like [Puma concolor]